MKRSKCESTRLFVYYDTQPRDLHKKIGSYLCTFPPHVTLAILQSKDMDETIATLERISNVVAPPHVQRGELFLKSRAPRKPAFHVHDPEFALYALQTHLTSEFAKQPSTEVIGTMNYNGQFSPHVTLPLFGEEPLAIPESFAIDHFNIAINDTHDGIVRPQQLVHTIDFSNIVMLTA